MAIQYSTLLSDVLARLAGQGNKYTPDQLKSFINEGKDEVWKALVEASEDYFLQFTVTTPSQSNTFAALNVATREYALPGDCLRPRLIEVLTPGYERTRFTYRKIHNPDFISQRNQSTAAGSSGSQSVFMTPPEEYFYTIGGKNTFILARYPEVAFTLKVWYVRALADLTDGSSLDETVAPFKADITNFAVKRATAVGKDAAGFAVWSESWRSSIINTVQAAGPRSETNAIYVTDREE